MFKNYVKIAIRNLSRNKIYAGINIFGLAIGLTCSILILLWVAYEISHDKFHEDVENVYHVMEHQQYSNDVNTTLNTPGLLFESLKEEVPEVEYAAPYTWNITNTFTSNNKSFREQGIYTSSEIFDILTINILNGAKDELLKQPKTIAISNEFALRVFGTQNVIGESIVVNGNQLHEVTGIFENLPDNSSLQFDYLLPYSDYIEQNEWVSDWGNHGPRTIVRLNPGTNHEELNTRISGFIKEKVGEDSNIDLFLFPFSKRYLYSRFENRAVAGGRIEYVRLFSIVAIFVLLIACINFMNLSTAKATKRAKEIGIRKSIGATKKSLITQFMGEAIMIAFLSMIISLLLVELSLPAFNNLTDKALSIDYLDPVFILSVLLITLFTGIISGSYPSLVLSSFEAVKTLKGRIGSSFADIFIRKGLVIFQFTMSIVLIISTLVIYRQIQFTQTKNLGYQKENLINFNIEDEVNDNWDAFHQELLRDPNILSVSRSGHRFLSGAFSTGGVNWQGKDPDASISFEFAHVDYDLVETMGFEILAGRTFSKEFGADSSRVIVNEAALAVMGFEDPLGSTMQFWRKDWEIVGVVKDFHFQSLRSAITPLFMVLESESTNEAFIRINSENINTTISNIEHTYSELYPLAPFNYSFIDQQFASLYKNEMRIGDLAKYFSIFTILISCLGLFGLSAFTSEQRTKEVGIRKVLGASVRSIILLLSKDFMWLILIAFALALPVSLWFTQDWLSDFAYKQSIEWWPFLVAGATTICIAWFTTSYQSIIAALANPINSLKSE